VLPELLRGGEVEGGREECLCKSAPVGTMYLKTVLQGLGNKAKLDAEDLYKLNEATFNMPEEENIDEKMTAKLFQAVEKSVQAYNTGKFDKADTNFFYDYVALLGTMQNQHFFSQKQNQTMIAWLKAALGKGADSKGEGNVEDKGASKADLKSISKLEEDNKKLAEELVKLRQLSNAVLTLKTIKLPEVDGKGKGKGKEGKGKEGKGEKGESGKGKEGKDGKGKGKGKDGKGSKEDDRPPADPARKELKTQVNAAGRALAKKKREVIETYGIEAADALDHEEVKPLLEALKVLKDRYMAMKGGEGGEGGEDAPEAKED